MLFRRLQAFALVGIAFIRPTTADRKAEGTRKVAIIGAGAAGSSTAYHLSKFADEQRIPIDITIFERTGHIGGRTRTVPVWDDLKQPVELGATIFVELNYIIFGAAKEFGFDINPKSEDVGPTTFWDGEKVRLMFYGNDSDTLMLVQKYGSALQDTFALSGNITEQFLKLYDEPYFPFPNLTTRVVELGLDKATGVLGSEFLDSHGISKAFADDYIQVNIRGNYAQNLDTLHGFMTMTSLQDSAFHSIVGGNWQLFQEMVTRSGADLKLHTSVTSIKNHHDGGFVLKTGCGSKAGTGTGALPVFDDVVIATPWQFSNIRDPQRLIKPSIEEIPYVKLHVTLFASPLRFDPTFFGVSGTGIPEDIFTTLAPDDEPPSGPEGVGKARFFSFQIWQTGINPKTNKKEYIYKIFSAEMVTPEFLSLVFDVQIPSTFIGRTNVEGKDVEPISWYYPHVWHSFPIGTPRTHFQDPVLAKGLYYSSGIESFISTMETSALMGKNIARLIVDGLVPGSAAGLE